jgi:ferric iron reductase protein FhuF
MKKPNTLTIEKARKHLWRIEKLTGDADYNSTTWEELKTASLDDLLQEARAYQDNYLYCHDSNLEDRALHLYTNFINKYEGARL